MIVEAGGVRMLGNPVKLSDLEEEDFGAAPQLGEHTREVLLEAGFSASEVSTLCPAS
jgi:formyl-CoA transferase